MPSMVAQIIDKVRDAAATLPDTKVVIGWPGPVTAVLPGQVWIYPINWARFEGVDSRSRRKLEMAILVGGKIGDDIGDSHAYTSIVDFADQVYDLFHPDVFGFTAVGDDIGVFEQVNRTEITLIALSNDPGAPAACLFVLEAYWVK
jgi:hypothetical protein